MTDISMDFTATGISASLYLAPFNDAPQTGSYSVSGTFVAALVLERTTNGGQTWEAVIEASAPVGVAVLRTPGTYRWRCTQYTSGTATVTLADLVDPVVLPIARNPTGATVLAATDAGIVTDAVRMANDVWLLTVDGTPVDGTDGTGAGFAGPSSLAFNFTGKAFYINTGTIDSPAWSSVAAGSGAVNEVTASGGLDSSGGSAPDISISDANLIELRDTGNISGNAGTATTATTAGNFSGNLAGDVTGPQGSTVVALVGGQSAANVAAGTALANAATSVDTISAIVRRDSSGNFAATTITADLVGNASTADSATDFTGALAGDVTGAQGATVVAFVSTATASDVGIATAATLAATSVNTASTIVVRDGSGRAQFTDPSAAQDAATKAYVDSVAVGLTVHTPAAVASTANLTLSGEQTIDGVLTSATRILVKNQSATAQNGIYVTGAGAWTRATDMDVWSEVPGSFVFVSGGTTQASSGWANTSTLSGTIDVTPMTWAQFSQAGTYSAGTGLTLTGSTFSVNYGTTSGTAAQGNDSRITGALQAANNLSDLANAAIAANNLGGASTTGTGGLVRTTSPTLVTPNIGTATGSVSGNAGSATVLQTARNINGVSFNGSANITVPAAGSTLTDAVPLTGLAAQAAHTFVANATGGSAAPTAISITTAASELADWKANTFSNFLAVVIADTSTARTLSATERGTVLTMFNASAITLTLHATAEVGYSVTVYQKGAGAITFAAASGATIRNRQSQTKSAGQYAVCTLFVESNAGSAAVWVLAGDTGA